MFARLKAKRLPIAVTLDPYDPDPQTVAGYLREVLRHLAENPVRARIDIRFAEEDASVRRPFSSLVRRRPKPSVPFGLDVSPSTGTPYVFVGEERAELRVGRLWLPDHPVPLAFPCTFRADPVSGGRIRMVLAR